MIRLRCAARNLQMGAVSKVWVQSPRTTGAGGWVATLHATVDLGV